MKRATLQIGSNFDLQNAAGANFMCLQACVYVCLCVQCVCVCVVMVMLSLHVAMCCHFCTYLPTSFFQSFCHVNAKKNQMRDVDINEAEQSCVKIMIV